MSEEIKKVLKMVEEGRISSEEGTKLIEAIKEKQEKKSLKGKYLRIYVEDDEDRVNIKIPLALAKWITKFIPEKKGTVKIGEREVDMPIDDVIEALIEQPDELVSVESEDGSKVIIRIE